MRNWKMLFDLCPIVQAARNARSISITAMAHMKAGADNEERMEEQLLYTSEYILLRGKTDGSYPGLLREVDVTPVCEVDEQAIMKLYQSVPEKHRKNAVFVMNAVTLHELYRTLRYGPQNLLTSRDDDSFMLMNVPIALCNTMPCIGAGSVPILYGDFSRIRIEDCGRAELQQKPREGYPGDVVCSMTGYVNYILLDRQAVKGLKVI